MVLCSCFLGRRDYKHKLSAVQTACDPKGSRDRRGADNHPSHEDAVVHEDGRLAVMGEDGTQVR